MTVIKASHYAETVERVQHNLIFGAFMLQDPQAIEFRNASNRSMIEREIFYRDSDTGELRAHHSFTCALNKRMHEILDRMRAQYPDEVAEIENGPLHIGAFPEAFIAYRESVRAMARRYGKLTDDQLDDKLDAGTTFADIFDSIFEQNGVKRAEH